MTHYTTTRAMLDWIEIENKKLRAQLDDCDLAHQDFHRVRASCSAALMRAETIAQLAKTAVRALAAEAEAAERPR